MAVEIGRRREKHPNNFSDDDQSSVQSKTNDFDGTVVAVAVVVVRTSGTKRSLVADNPPDDRM